MTTTLPDAETLSTEFAIVLNEWLGTEKLREVNLRNAADPNGNGCATHDFCDANMAMDEAFRRFNVEIDIQDDAQLALWNRAWNLAKARGFDVEGK